MQHPTAREIATDQVTAIKRQFRRLPNKHVSAAQKELWFWLLDEAGGVLPGLVRGHTYVSIGGENGVSDRSARDTLGKLAERGFITIRNDNGMLTIWVRDPTEPIRAVFTDPETQPSLFTAEPEPPEALPLVAFVGDDLTGSSAQNSPSPPGVTTGSSAQYSPSRGDAFEQQAQQPPSLAAETVGRATGSSAQNSPSRTSREYLEFLNGSRESREVVNRVVFLRQEVEADAWDLWNRAGRPKPGRGGDGLGNLWKAAAAWRAGLLSDDDVFDTCEGTRRAKRPDPRYFYRVLQNRLRKRDEDLLAVLAKVRIDPHLPQDAPKAPTAARRVGVNIVRSPPPDDWRQRDAFHAEQLAKLEAEESERP